MMLDPEKLPRYYRGVGSFSTRAGMASTWVFDIDLQPPVSQRAGLSS